MHMEQVGVEEVHVHVGDDAVKSIFIAIRRRILDVHGGKRKTIKINESSPHFVHIRQMYGRVFL